MCIRDSRHLPLHLQVEHFISMGTIDDVIISNCYPSDEELAILKDLPRNLVCFDVELIDNLPEVERSIVLDELHFNRGDVSANFLRSTPVSYTHLRVSTCEGNSKSRPPCSQIGMRAPRGAASR